jgi:group I intron endonuclease
MIKFNGNKDDLNKSGIYCILNLRDGKRYIGSAHNFGKRLYSHSYRLKNKKHNNPIMQNTYDKFGLDIFEFLIIEICIIDDLIKIEQRYLDDVFMINNHYDYYYNVVKSASAPMAGRKHTEESLKKMRGESHNAFGKRGEECPNFGRKQ